MAYTQIFQRFAGLSLITAMILLISFNLYAQDKKDVKEDSTGAYYIIKKGDTLWGLSKKFLNSPWKWPELWKANSDANIANPNLIYPGQRIRLLPRDDKGIAGKAVQAGTPVQAAPLPGTSMPAPLPGTPSPAAPAVSLPSGASAPSAQSANFDSISGSEKGKYFHYSLIDQAGFILRDQFMPSGNIFKVKDDKKMISNGDIVYIKQSGGVSIDKGKFYTIYRTSNIIMDSRTKRPLGRHYIMLGVVEIIRKEPEFLMGRITRSFRSIRVNDLLMPYEKRSPKILLAEGRKGVSGTVIASEAHTKMMGEHSIAFIDRGKEDGVLPGQQYKVFYQETARPDMKSKAKITLPPSDFASMLVLIATPSTSTVLFIYSEKPVEPGAKFHVPE